MKKVIVAIIDGNGKILKKNITCPTCGKEIVFIDHETVFCKKCGEKGRNWDIKRLLKTLRRISGENLTFIETH